jgi:hypothetical protein
LTCVNTGLRNLASLKLIRFLYDGAWTALAFIWGHAHIRRRGAAYLMGGDLWRVSRAGRFGEARFATYFCFLVLILPLYSRGKFLVIIVAHSSAVPEREKLLKTMLALAQCGRQQRILVAGGKSIELTFELERDGYSRAASVANCGRAAKQYDVALVDWRRRTFRSLEETLDWLVDFLHPDGRLLVATDPQKAQAREALNAALEKRGFVVEDAIIYDGGYAVSARSRAFRPILQAA